MILSLDKRIFLIALIIFINVLGVGLILPLLPFYAEKLGASPVIIGLFIAMYPFFSLLSGPSLGALSDKYGRKPVLLFSLVGTVIGFFLLGFAQSLPLLFLARIIDGASAGNTSTAQAAIADITSKERRVSGLGYIFAAESLGLILGPTMGLLSQYGYAVPAYVAAFIAFIGLLLTLLFLPETRDFSTQPQGERKKAIFNSKDFLRTIHQPEKRSLIFAIFLIHFLIIMMWGTFSLYGEHLFKLTGREIGYISAFAALVGILAQTGLLKGISSIANEERILPGALLIMSIGLFLLALANSIAVVLIGIGCMAACYNIAMPVATGLISKISSEHEQGFVMGTVSAVINIASLAGPVIGTSIYSFSPQGNYYFASSLGLLAMIMSMRQLKRRGT